MLAVNFWRCISCIWIGVACAGCAGSPYRFYDKQNVSLLGPLRREHGDAAVSYTNLQIDFTKGSALQKRISIVLNDGTVVPLVSISRFSFRDPAIPQDGEKFIERCIFYFSDRGDVTGVQIDGSRPEDLPTIYDSRTAHRYKFPLSQGDVESLFGPADRQVDCDVH